MKVVSLAIFGENHAKYAVNLPAFVLGHLNVFPIAEDWVLRVHIDLAVANSPYGAILRALQNRGLAELRLMPAAPLTKAMLWRVAPAFDQDVDFTFARDLDAPPMPRDRACCEHFMVSGMDVHTIHDNVAHCGIMGGLSGYATGFREATGFKSIGELHAWCERHYNVDWAQHGSDQIMLNRLILTEGGPSLFEHRFSGWQSATPGVGPKRAPGRYRCRGMSAPIPDKGWRKLPPEADQLGAHLGCAGYDFQAAERFWRDHGSADVAASVSAAIVEATAE